MRANLALAPRVLAVLAPFSLLMISGCRLVKQTADLPAKTVGMVTQSGKPKTPVADPVEVQQTLLRFADGFSTRMVIGVDKLQQATNALDPSEALKAKIAFASGTCTIASGPNAFANLLDMTVFVTVTRMAVEEYWQPKRFGDSAQPLLESCRKAEAEIWQFAGKVLTAEQQTELRKAIETWYRQNSQPETVLAARAVSFAARVAEASEDDKANSGSVFSLLKIDPLSGMDPAVRELAQTRMFAERALYVTQKTPTILRWQAELLSLNTVQMSAVQQILTNSTQLTSSVEAFSRVAEQLPKLVNDQREAAIKQLFDGLATERTNLIANLAADDMKLRATLVELRQTLDAGNALMKSSDLTVKSLDTFMARFDKDTNAPPKPTVIVTNARPFDILDYAATAKEVTMTMKELNATIGSLDKALPQVQKAAETLEDTGNRLLNRIFFIGAGLLALFFIGGVIVLVIYKRLTPSSSAPALARRTDAREPTTSGM
jgi:hypothetical protein